jgi:hypothetical protein
MFPTNATFHPETNDPILALFTEVDGQMSRHTLMPCLVTHPARKLIIHIDHLESELRYDYQICQAGHSRALVCGRTREWVSELILSDIHDDALVHTKVSLHTPVLQMALDKVDAIQWDETTGIVCLEDDSGFVTILQL